MRRVDEALQQLNSSARILFSVTSITQALQRLLLKDIQTTGNRFVDIGQSSPFGLALGMAAFDGGAGGHVVAVLVFLENHIESHENKYITAQPAIPGSGLGSYQRSLAWFSCFEGG